MTLRRLGEGLELESLNPSARAPLACAVESAASSSVFLAPRSGADRYADWADFEYACRLPAGAVRSRAWRIAEDGDRVCFLGQSATDEGAYYPLAAALWRGWFADRQATERALFWQGCLGGHLWILSSSKFPRYVEFTGTASPEALLVALSCHGKAQAFTLELGGVSPEVAQELSTLFPGPVVSAEPFARLRVSAALRETLLRLDDPTVYLPAVGAARALLEGPPTPLAVR